jgi:hypothetical protein
VLGHRLEIENAGQLSDVQTEAAAEAAGAFARPRAMRRGGGDRGVRCADMRAKLRPLRYWGPLVLACVCLIAAYSVPPWATYVLVIVSFMLLFEVGTALFEKAGSTGGLKDFRQ